MSHLGKIVSIYEIAGFVDTALPSAMISNNIINAFKKTGIFPYNLYAFRDNDFLPSLVSERPDAIDVSTEETNNVTGLLSSPCNECCSIIRVYHD